MINKDFNSVLDLLSTFQDEQSCINHLEDLRWGDLVISPYDPESKVYKCKGINYRCKNSGKYFNVLTGSLFENSKVPLRKWFLAIYLETSHKKGISSVQLSKDINVTQKTAWFMLHRIRKCFGYENSWELGNEVEIDETFVGGKNKNRHWDKKVKNSQGRSFKDKTPVVGMLERGGKLVAKKVENTNASELTPHILDVIKPNSIVYTDEWVAYKDIHLLYDHHIVSHGKGEYVNGLAYTNNIEGCWAMLKRSIFGIYHSVSKKHLQKYVDGFVFRYNTRKDKEWERFNNLLANGQNRLTYKSLIHG